MVMKIVSIVECGRCDAKKPPAQKHNNFRTIITNSSLISHNNKNFLLQDSAQESKTLNEKKTQASQALVGHQKLRSWSPRRRSIDAYHRAVQCRVVVQVKGLHDRLNPAKVSMRRKEEELGSRGLVLRTARLRLA